MSDLIVHEKFESDWEVVDDQSRIEFSNVRKPWIARGHIGLKVFLGFVGFVPISCLLDLLRGVHDDRPTPSGVFVLGAVFLLGLSVLIYRIRPRKQGLEVVATAQGINLRRYYQGRVILEYSGLIPQGFLVTVASRSWWYLRGGRVGADRGRSWQVSQQFVFLIEAQTASGNQEICWSKDYPLAMETVSKLAKVANVKVCDETGESRFFEATAPGEGPKA